MTLRFRRMHSPMPLLGAAKDAVFAALRTYDARDSGAQQLIETKAFTALIDE